MINKFRVGEEVYVIFKNASLLEKGTDVFTGDSRVNPPKKLAGIYGWGWIEKIKPTYIIVKKGCGTRARFPEKEIKKSSWSFIFEGI